MIVHQDGAAQVLASGLRVEDASTNLNVYVGEATTGLGVFAARDLAPSSWILSFEGPLIGMDHPVAQLDQDGVLLQVGRHTYLMPHPPAALLNHSCDPNAGLFKDVHLVALQWIRTGEQICFDYSTTMHENNWSLQCACGTATCRGRIGDFVSLPVADQERYRRLGVVSSFVPV